MAEHTLMERVALVAQEDLAVAQEILDQVIPYLVDLRKVVKVMLVEILQIIILRMVAQVAVAQAQLEQIALQVLVLMEEMEFLYRLKVLQ